MSSFTMSSFISKLDNRMNPIVVKELRQGVQSRFIVFIVNVLLAALCAAYLLTVMLNPTALDDATGGQILFSIFQGVLILATSIGIPIYLIARLCSERNGTNVDLFFTTSLHCHEIVRGKFLSGMVLVTLLYSICLPFMLCTNLLRGFDIPTMLYTLVISYTTTTLDVMLAITIGSWALPRVLTPLIIFFSLFFFLFFNLIFAQSTLGVLMLGTQVLFRDNTAAVIGGFVVFLIFLSLGVKLLGSLAVGLLSSPSSNRTCRLRAWSSISIAAMLLILALYMWFLGALSSSSWNDFMGMASGSMIYWLVLSTLLLCGMMLVAMCEPDGFSRRIMKDRPLDERRRLIAFLYTYGASGGFAWAIFHALGVWVIFFLFLMVQKSTTSGVMPGEECGTTLAWSVLCFSCIACYAFLTKGIMRTILKQIPTKFAWGLFLPLIAILPITVMLLCFAMDPGGWTDNILWKLFLPIPGFGHDSDITIRMTLTIFGTIIMALTSSPFGLHDVETYMGGLLEIPPAEPAVVLATVVDSDAPPMPEETQS